MKNRIPRSDPASASLFRSLVPKDPQVTIRPMFGNFSAFVNGNMFFGVFGDNLFLRLSEEDRAEILKNKGAALLEPMKGRPMKDYVVVPRVWRDDPQTLQFWVSRSLDWSGSLPPKKKK